MYKKPTQEMQTLFIADKSLTELEDLFACDIENDQDFYDVLAYQISQQEPEHLIKHLHLYQGLRLRGAVFGLGFSPKPSQQQKEILFALLSHADPLIIAEAIQALKNAGYFDAWEKVSTFQKHPSPYVKGAVARFARAALPKEKVFHLLIDNLSCAV